MSSSPPSVDATPALEMHGIAKKYGAHWAVDHVSLQVRRGDFVTLLGPSGSGKTTCLRMIAGMVRPDGGTVRIAGTDVSGVPMNKRNIGMVFQNYSLFPHLSVAQNVGYPLRVRRTNRSEAERLVAEALEMVKLEGFAQRKPSQLSGGQQQRVALARALVFKPDLLLLDEPLSALDRVLREGMQLELRRIHESTGTTMVCVTHDRTEALTMSNRVIVLRDGRIEQDANPIEIYQRSNSRFVAEFLGETNTVTMTARRSTDGLQLDDGTGNTLLVPDQDDLEIGSCVDLVTRVEMVSVHKRGESDPVRGWAGTVQEAVFLGDAVRYRVQCGERSVVARMPVHSVDPDVSVGTTVDVLLDPERAMLFAADDPPALRK